MSSLLVAAFARAKNFLLEPQPALEATALRPSTAAGPPDAGAVDQVEAVVIGLSPRSGASTLACGLAANLAVPGARPAQLIAVAGSGRSPASFRSATLAGGAQWEVPANLRDPREVAEYGAMLARLLARPAALVWDVSSSEAERAALAAREADVVVVVAPGGSEPSLAELVREMLAARFGRVVLAANRVNGSAGWSGRAAVFVPESRIGALLAGRGRRPGGAFGAALGELAALVERDH